MLGRRKAIHGLPGSNLLQLWCFVVGTPKTSRISNFDVGMKYLEKAKELIEDYYSSINVFERSRVMTPEHAEIYERIAKYMEMNDMKVNNYIITTIVQIQSI
jgi:hypothetical protein